MADKDSGEIRNQQSKIVIHQSSIIPFAARLQYAAGLREDEGRGFALSGAVHWLGPPGGSVLAGWKGVD